MCCFRTPKNSKLGHFIFPREMCKILAACMICTYLCLSILIVKNYTCILINAFSSWLDRNSPSFLLIQDIRRPMLISGISMSCQYGLNWIYNIITKVWFEIWNWPKFAIPLKIGQNDFIISQKLWNQPHELQKSKWRRSILSLFFFLVLFLSC